MRPAECAGLLLGYPKSHCIPAHDLMAMHGQCLGWPLACRLPLGPCAVLNTSVDPNFFDQQRPTLAQTFKHLPTGACGCMVQGKADCTCACEQ
jgi:hypothetical protein